MSCSTPRCGVLRCRRAWIIVSVPTCTCVFSAYLILPTYHARRFKEAWKDGDVDSVFSMLGLSDEYWKSSDRLFLVTSDSTTWLCPRLGEHPPSGGHRQIWVLDEHDNCAYDYAIYGSRSQWVGLSIHPLNMGQLLKARRAISGNWGGAGGPEFNVTLWGVELTDPEPD